ncbi:MAG: YdcF family protein [Burkholderiales bacterium]|nr:YdcF family protein [Burkholderiales bacterium]
MKTEGVIIILGSRNDDNGNLTTNAKKRIEKAIEIFNKYKNYKLLPTGGYGAHFNTTNKPHSFYIKRYLLSERIPESEILQIIESKNTIEDLKFSKKLIDTLEIQKIILVTSDFHVLRVRLLSKKIFERVYNIKVIGTQNTHPLNIKINRYYHEIKQIVKILLGIIKI